MNDPIRLLDDGGGASARERDVLRAGRAEGPTPREKQALWTAIAAQSALAIPGASAQTATNGAASAGAQIVTSGATGAGGTSLAVKATLVAIAIGSGVFTTTRVLRRAPAPPAIVETSPAAQPPTPAPPAPPSATLPPSETAVAPRAATARPARPQIAHDLPAREPTPSRLAAEGRAVVEAKRALRAGDAASALRLLEAADRAFPDGALGQEREALAIEALDRAGRREAARARAQAFLRTYPTSPHATNVRRFAGEP